MEIFIRDINENFNERIQFIESKENNIFQKSTRRDYFL